MSWGAPTQCDVVVTDLRETLDLLGRIEVLTVQRDRLVRLVATLEGGESLSPMPPRVAVFYDALAAAAPDEVTLTGVRRERDFLGLAYLRGEVPPEAELLFGRGGRPDSQREPGRLSRRSHLLVGTVVLLIGWAPRMAWLAWLPWAASVALALLGALLGIPQAIIALGPLYPSYGISTPLARVAVFTLTVSLGLWALRHRDLARG